jgi:signal transduction histidine kinase
VKKQIALICTLDDTVPACPIDSRRLKQVLLNLIMNAGQAIVTNGTINIRTRAENSSIIIEVEDDGPGISKDIQDKIFDPFFSTKEPGEGTGLGLSVSYGIIQEHDGEIMVRSTPGHGTCFTLILPASSEHMSDE